MEAVTGIIDAHGRKLATLASIVLVVLMSLSIANAVLFFARNLGDDAIAPEPVQVTGSSTPDRPRVDIASLDLFGTAEQQQSQPQVVDAPETKLNLELQGVFTADDPELSTAIVAERNKPGELFRIGERLPGNATLESVHDDHILIRRGGRVEKLMFADATLRQRFTSSSSASPGPRARATAVPPATGSSDSRLQNIRERIAERRREAAQRYETGPSGQGGNVPEVSIRERVDAYRSRLQENPQAVLSELGVSAVSSGEARGYRIDGSAPQAALQQAGLRQGDVILSVNGRPVGNVVNDRQMIDQAMDAGRVRVEVQREQRRFFLTVPVPQ